MYLASFVGKNNVAGLWLPYITLRECVHLGATGEAAALGGTCHHTHIVGCMLQQGGGIVLKCGKILLVKHLRVINPAVKAV